MPRFTKKSQAIMDQIDFNDLMENPEKIKDVISELDKTTKMNKGGNPKIKSMTPEEKIQHMANMRQIAKENREKRKAEKEQEKAEKERLIREAREKEIENRVRLELLKQKEAKEREKLELKRIREEKKNIRLKKRMAELEEAEDDEDEIEVEAPVKRRVERVSQPVMPVQEPVVQLSRYEIMKALENRRW